MNRILATTTAGLILLTATLTACSSTDQQNQGTATPVPTASADTTQPAAPQEPSEVIQEGAPDMDGELLTNVELEKITLKKGEPVEVKIDPTWLTYGSGISAFSDNNDIAILNEEVNPVEGTVIFDTKSAGTTKVGVTRTTAGNDGNLSESEWVGYEVTVTE